MVRVDAPIVEHSNKFVQLYFGTTRRQLVLYERTTVQKVSLFALKGSRLPRSLGAPAEQTMSSSTKFKGIEKFLCDRIAPRLSIGLRVSIGIVNESGEVAEEAEDAGT